MNSTVTIRPLAESDSLADLTDLLHRAYKPLLDMGLRYWATHQSEDDTRTRIAGGICLVASIGDRVVGTITYQRHTTWDGSPWMRRSDVASVGQFAVEPRLQRQGIGAALMREVERIAKADGVHELALNTAEPAVHLIAYYTKLGYRFMEHTDATLDQGYRSVILSKRVRGDDEALAGFLEHITAWAAERQDIDGVMLVGSHARGTARPDSDIDLVILARDPPSFMDDTSWMVVFGDLLQVESEDYGPVQSLRARYASGKEVEFGIASPEWASIEPLDSGTAQVIRDGARILVDKSSRLEALVDCVREMGE